MPALVEKLKVIGVLNQRVVSLPRVVIVVTKAKQTHSQFDNHEDLSLKQGPSGLVSELRDLEGPLAHWEGNLHLLLIIAIILSLADCVAHTVLCKFLLDFAPDLEIDKLVLTGHTDNQDHRISLDEELV